MVEIAGIGPEDLSMSELLKFYFHTEKLYQSAKTTMQKGKQSIVLGMIKKEVEKRGYNFDDLL